MSTPNKTEDPISQANPQRPFVSRLRIGKYLASRLPAFLASKSVQPWLLCLPALLIFGIFFVGPTFLGLVFSFTRWNGISPMEFIGLANYAELISTQRFWKDLTINFVVVIALLLIELPFALFLAIGLVRKTPLNTFFRSVFFVPQQLSITVAALTWRFLYSPTIGLVNRLLEVVGLSSLQRAWLGEKEVALAAVLISFIWWSFGFRTILFLAGLSSIPSELYEALHLESNRWYHELRYVTLPMLRETIVIAFALTMSSAFGSAIGYFDLMTNGGPQGATEILGLYAASTALLGTRFGYSSSITIVMLVIILSLVIGPILYVARERVEYVQ